MIFFSQFTQNDIAKKNISSSLFQYSDRTVASTETNDTLTERSDTELFGAGKSKGVALSGGHHAPLPQKHILLNFMAARRVFDFLPSMRSLGHHF